MPEHPNPFAQWLHRYIEERGVTRAQVAEQFAVSLSTIKLYLSGDREPSWVTLQQIKKAIPSLDMNTLFH